MSVATGRTCAASILACVALGAITTPALADPNPALTGTFLIEAGQESSTWTVVSACLPDCIARVRSSDGWRGSAIQQSGRWTMSVYLGGWTRSSYPADPATCTSDGSIVTVSEDFSFDSQTLTGTVDRIRGDRCQGPRTAERSALTLTRTE